MITIRKIVDLKDIKKIKKKRSSQGWRNIAGRRIYFRSSWEVKYAHYLEFLKKNKLIIDWQYEPKTFWFDGIKRGTVSYLPDFKVINPDNSHYWIEVKGYMDAKSKTKIKRFNKYYPNEVLRIVDAEWFKKNKSYLSVCKKEQSDEEVNVD